MGTVQNPAATQSSKVIVPDLGILSPDSLVNFLVALPGAVVCRRLVVVSSMK